MTNRKQVSVADTRQPMLTVEDVAAYLQVPDNTVYRWNTRGTGPRRHKIGRNVRYRLEDVDEWVRNQLR